MSTTGRTPKSRSKWFQNVESMLDLGTALSRNAAPREFVTSSNCVAPGSSRQTLLMSLTRNLHTRVHGATRAPHLCPSLSTSESVRLWEPHSAGLELRRDLATEISVVLGGFFPSPWAKQFCPLWRTAVFHHLTGETIVVLMENCAPWNNGNPSATTSSRLLSTTPRGGKSRSPTLPSTLLRWGRGQHTDQGPAALAESHRLKHRTYPEVCGPKAARLVVVAVEVGGRWSEEDLVLREAVHVRLGTFGGVLSCLAPQHTR